MRSRAFLGLLVLAAIVGLVASLAAWGFLELVHQVQTGVWDKLPDWVGYDDGAPLWWAVPVLAIAGALVAVAIVRLPGEGGHVPAEGLKTGVTQPIELPSVLLAAVAGIGLGVVLGPEAPLIALGGGLGVFVIRRARKDAPEELTAVMAAAGTFAALAMIFESPLIASVVVIEAAGLGGPRLPMVLVPGMLAAGIGSLMLVGMGSWTGLNTEDIAIETLDLPNFARPDVADVGWTILLAVATAVVAFLIVRAGPGSPPSIHGAAVPAPTARRDRRCGPGHRLRRDDRQGGRPGAVLGPGGRRTARIQRRHVVAHGPRAAHRLQGDRLGDLAREPFAAVRSSRRCCSVRPPG